jgi:predicted enzyme related to lactoylglutathione lyase
MQEVPEYKPGTFCWVELGTSDASAAKDFYSKLFGWNYDDKPMGPDGVYTMLMVKGKDAGGLYELMPDMKAQGIPPHWLSYVLVSSADETAAKAKATGATLLKEPFDVPGAGRMAVMQDPTGAVFAIWEGKEHKGAGICNVANTFCWNEVLTPDTQKAGDFYTNLFGWTKQQFGGDYTIFNNGDRGAGGMFQITAEMGPIPPNWMVYFAVDDCDAMVQKTTELGGKVLKAAEDIPTIGRYAVLQDPQSAAFAIIKPEQPEH